MTLDDLLKEITDHNRWAILKGIEPKELESANRATWQTIFKEAKKLWESQISLKEKREITRQIYPHYKIENAEGNQMRAETQKTFDDLMKSPTFLHAVHKWQHSSVEQRPEVAQILAREVMQHMPGIGQGYLETFNEETSTLAFASDADTQAVIHLNTNKKAFENQTLADVLGNLHHEATHIVQRGQLTEKTEFTAPIFNPTPKKEIKEKLEKEGYVFNRDDYISYLHHPREIEAWIKGTEMTQLIQAELAKGLGKGMMQSPYDSEKEELEFNKNPKVELRGTKEDLNPYRHLYAGIASAKMALSCPIYDTSRKIDCVCNCIRHFDAVLKYGEFLAKEGNDIPVPHMLSSLNHYMKNPVFKQTLKQSGFEKLAHSIFEKCAQSPNPSVSSKARMLLQLQKTEAEHSEQSPMDKHNAIDIRNAFRDRKTAPKTEETKSNSAEGERQRKRAEILQQFEGVKKGFSL